MSFIWNTVDCFAITEDNQKKLKKPRPKPMLGGITLDIPVAPKTKKLDLSSYNTHWNDRDFESSEELGIGSGGAVHLVRHRPSKILMARKIIHNYHNDSNGNIEQELKLLKQCNSPYIITFHGANFIDGDLHIYMEYMNIGSLEKIANITGKVREDILIKISMAVLEGLVYLHEEQKILHRDIKPSNILLNSEGMVKICDFGVSRETLNSVANTFVGTGFYMSPERIQGSNKYSYNADTWSLGLTILEMALGYYPFSDGQDSYLLSEFELLSRIVNDDPPSPSPHEYSSDFRDFISQCLIKDSNIRPLSKQLLNNHSIMKHGRNLNVDLASWAKTLLQSNLNSQQLKRWSVKQQLRRVSLIEKKHSRNL